MVAYGGLILQMGGLVTQAGPPTQVFSNAVFSLDLGTFVAAKLAGGSPPVPDWVRVTDNGKNPWAPRMAHSLDVYADTVVLFGGFTRNVNANVPVGNQMICAVSNAACVAYNDVWLFAPGLPSMTPPPACPGGGDCGWVQGRAATGVAPQPRFWHSSGVLADNLYIFGGNDAAGGRFTDLWAYNLPNQAWTPVATTFIAGTAGFPPQAWPPAGAFNGHRFYNAMTGDQGGNALFRWTPEAAAPLPAPAAAAASGLTAAQNAGIVFSTLFGFVNMAALSFFVYRAVRASRADVAAIGSAYEGLGDKPALSA